MDSIENGSVDPLNSSSSDQGTSVSSASSNIVQLISQQNAHQVKATNYFYGDAYLLSFEFTDSRAIRDSAKPAVRDSNSYRKHTTSQKCFISE